MGWRLAHLLRSRTAVGLGIGLAVGAAVLAARRQGWLVPLELWAYDRGLAALPARKDPPPVALVWIREEEIAAYGHPLPDELLARAIDQLRRLGARAIGVDLYKDHSQSEALREAVLADLRVVMVEKLPDAEHPEGVARPPFLADRSQVGFSDLLADPDGVVRRGLLLLLDPGGEEVLSLALQLALRQLAPEGLGIAADPERPDRMRLGATTIPWLDADFGGYAGANPGGYQFPLDHRRAPGWLPSVALRDLLEGRAAPELFRDRVAILGTRAPSVKDAFRTPRGLCGDPPVFGAEVHAAAVDQLVRHALRGERPIAAASEPVEALWIALWCAAAGVVGTRLRSPLGLALAAAACVALLAAVSLGALAAALWIPVAAPAAGGLASLGLALAWVTQRERAEKAVAVRLFGTYVSRAVVDEIWRQRELFMEGGRPRPERITVTVLMSDLSGYTSTSEKLEAASVMEWIGRYMDAMARLVEARGGFVNDFLGDGLMATFGAPVPRLREDEIDRDAVNAVECALDMAAQLERLNQRWREEGARTARMRIGITTGPAIVGSLGSRERLKYATVGDTVNTASRLESFDKDAFDAEPERFRILVGEETHRRLGGRFHTRPLGARALRGKGEPVEIYRVLGRA
jgi:adenylate cyclase